MLIDVMRTATSTSNSYAKEHDKDYVTDIHITLNCLCYSIFVRSHNMFTYMRFKAPSGKELHKKRETNGKRESNALLLRLVESNQSIDNFNGIYRHRIISLEMASNSVSLSRLLFVHLMPLRDSCLENSI